MIVNMAEELGLLQWSRAQSVESEPLLCVDNSKFSGHSKNSALASRVGKLRSRTSDESDDTGNIDDASVVLLVASQGKDSVFAAKPYTFDVDVHGQVPNLLRGVDSVIVVCMHDSGVVENDIETAPRIEALDHGLNLVLFTNVTLVDFQLLRVWNNFKHFGFCLCQCLGVQVGHQDLCTLLSEQNGGLETDTAVTCQIDCILSPRLNVPSGSCDDGILSKQSSRAQKLLCISGLFACHVGWIWEG